MDSLADGGRRGIEMWILPVTHKAHGGDPVSGRVGTVPWVSLV